MKIHTGSEPWNHAAALYVRMNVFVLERTIAIEDEFDDHDEADRVYVVIYSDKASQSRLVGSRRSTTPPCGQAELPR
ncbi:hypothetical protein [Secundilactobacillus silagei]|uniref:hypothetical protein n=1 Tax=Secundilactobacillus silagei TaxID=1293415 RepID=UPI000B272AE9